MRGQRALGEAGVVEQQVDVAEAVRQRVDGGAHRGVVADVEGGDVHLVGAEFGGERLQAFGAAAGGDDVPAGGDETLRGGGAEAGGGAGDECGLGHACLAMRRITSGYQMNGIRRLVSRA